LIGFSEEEFNELLDLLRSENPDEDSLPEAPAEAVSRRGDVWHMGAHRLVCGDATDAASFPDLLWGDRADMVFTDPPYNVYYRVASSGASIPNDDLGRDFRAFLENACGNLLRYTWGAVYICMSSSEMHTLHRAFTQAGGHWSTFLIWGKSTFTLGRSDYHRQYEPILYGWREGSPHHWCGARDRGDLWLFDKPRVNDLHPSMKPVGLIERAVCNSSKRGGIVLDPFAGSGSTVIACEKAGRMARLIELEPIYCDVILQRWQQFTGKEAIQTVTDATFNQLRAKSATAADARSDADFPARGLGEGSQGG
jgi:DNA modification methylase